MVSAEHWISEFDLIDVARCSVMQGAASSQGPRHPCRAGRGGGWRGFDLCCSLRPKVRRESLPGPLGVGGWSDAVGAHQRRLHPSGGSDSG